MSGDGEGFITARLIPSPLRPLLNLEGSTFRITDTLPSCFVWLVCFVPLSLPFLLSVISHRSIFIFDPGRFLYNDKPHILVSLALSAYTTRFSLPLEDCCAPTESQALRVPLPDRQLVSGGVVRGQRGRTSLNLTQLCGETLGWVRSNCLHHIVSSELGSWFPAGLDHRQNRWSPRHSASQSDAAGCPQW